MSLIRITFVPLVVLLILASHVISSASELTFLSGVADTKQYFTIDSIMTTENMSKNKRIIKRHHLICLHKGPFHQYNVVYNASPEKCCNDLWLKGLIETKHRQYCLDRMALLPEIQSPAASIESVLEGVDFSRGDVRPIHFLTVDEELHEDETVYTLNSTYLQVRYVMARDEHKERENIRDLPDYGVVSYSPFHLVDFMPGGREAMKLGQVANTDHSLVSFMYGRVNTTLSSDGGMHRAFRQRVALSLNGIETAQYIEATKFRMEINTNVLLPLMESVFIDADDPLIAEYDDSPEPILCRTSILDHESLVSKSKCGIKFISSETIDIEQPSFVSRQYVVAFQLNATIEFSTNNLSELLEQKIQIGLDYGTTLHIRYLSPTSNQTGVLDGLNGMVPIAIHQPTLYSSIVFLMEGVSGSEVQYFLLNNDAAPPEVQRESTIQEPITIHVAVGLDGDFWWVTTLTMLCALFGGFIVMRSIDSVSFFD